MPPQQLLLRLDAVLKYGNDEALKSSRCFDDIPTFLQRRRLLMLLNLVDEFIDSLDKDDVLDVLLELRYHHSLLVIDGKDVVHGGFGTLTNCLPYYSTEHRCVYVSNLFLQTHFKWLTIAKDTFAELCPDAQEDWEHFDSVCNHESLVVEDFKNAHDPVA